ncbi:transcriptional regulator [Candidatus Woesearchaeota archaeon CG_4_10_14_0_2_um_filter_57_5]|nr:MAG: transcriptional regulator [Candidatus Woesearchaeota archaeon CG1_02_57_44]PIN69142.1 MAG: transcriptional regulator [Candidatus Woesearchaeota archaeon CG11_big_fil_rev_8_21_14_0_20_57_5]PIZ51711.1 MAG: transcriptional regulator [Candidatus Woesearchaeota archaeon CG_4_10_14_0_2_um_filter_57_5]
MALSKNLLRERREAKGLSQEALAGMVGVSRQTIISIEGARYMPSLELALRLAKAFRCKVEELFGV